LARNAGCVLADTLAPDKCWLLRDSGSLSVAVFSLSGLDACRADVPLVPWLAVNSRRSPRSPTSHTCAQTASPALPRASAPQHWPPACTSSSNLRTGPAAPRSPRPPPPAHPPRPNRLLFAQLCPRRVGRVIDHVDQTTLRSSLLQPGVKAPVHLHHLPKVFLAIAPSPMPPPFPLPAP